MKRWVHVVICASAVMSAHAVAQSTQSTQSPNQPNYQITQSPNQPDHKITRSPNHQIFGRI